MHTLAPLTVQTAWQHWTIAWVSLIISGLLGTCYLAAVRRLRRRGQPWPISRTINFIILGLGSWLIATMSFLGAYAHVLFWVYATQLIILLTVTPALLALGAPLTLAELALSPSTAARIRAWPQTRIGRITTFPLVGTLLLTTVPFAVYFTGLFEFVMRHQTAYHLGQVALVMIGFLFFWPLLGSDDVKRWPWPLATLIVFAETTFDSIPGIAIWLSTKLIAPTYYAEVGRTWGRSRLSDQKFGGVMLWAVGEVVGIPLLIAMVTQWMHADEREAARIDRELDTQAGLVPETLPAASEIPDATPNPPSDDAASGLEVPWWQADPEQLRRSRKFDW